MLAILLFLLTMAASASDVRVGRAQAVITPPPAMPMAGYYNIRLSQGVHDDLHAKAIVIEKDGVRAALVACDLIGIPRAIVEAARARIEAATGIPGANVMISATHSHTGPDTGSRLVNVDEATLKVVRAYHAELPVRIAAAVKAAADSLAPARVWFGEGREDSIAFVRRFWMADGTVGWNPGKRNPKIVRPAGEIDAAVPVVWFETPEAKPLAAYVNYANHLDTVGGFEFSADYPYTLGKILREAKAADLVTLFTIGTAGNINHIDVSTARPQKGHEEAARIGAILAGEVLRTLSRKLGAADPEARLAVSREIVPLPLGEAGDLAKAREVLASFGKPNPAAFLDQVRAFRAIDIDGRKGKPLDAEVQVIALGRDVAWVGLPGEVFVELGKAIKVASPFRLTIVAELAGDSPGYIPARQAYPQGAYEVISSRVAAGAGEKLVESAVRQLVELHGLALRVSPPPR